MSVYPLKDQVISPDNQIYLNRWGDADTEWVTAGNKGDVEGQKKSSPRSINFSKTPQGKLDAAILPQLQRKRRSARNTTDNAASTSGSEVQLHVGKT